MLGLRADAVSLQNFTAGNQQILDAQMQSLAGRWPNHQPAPVKSEFDPEQHYHEDLFVDVWSYAEQAHQHHEFNLLIQPIEHAGFFIRIKLSTAHGALMCAFKKSAGSRSASDCLYGRSGFGAGRRHVYPYLLFMPFAIWGLSWMISRILAAG